MAESRADGVTNGAYAILAGDNHGCFVFEAFGRHIYVSELRFEVTVDILKVLRNSLLHLDLNATVLRVNIVKELLAGLAVVELYVVIEVFVDMLKVAFLAYFQAEVIETSKLIVHVHAADGIFESGGAIEQYRTEVEVVAESAELVVDYGSLRYGIPYFIEVIRINHVSSGIFNEANHALKAEEHKR